MDNELKFDKPDFLLPSQINWAEMPDDLLEDYASDGVQQATTELRRREGHRTLTEAS